MERSERLDELLFAVLMLAGLGIRLSLVGGLELYSDATDPIRDAYDLLRGEYPWAGRNAVFGVGRTWSYVPLVVLGTSLERLWSLRALMGAFAAPWLLIALKDAEVPRAIRVGLALVLVGAAPVLDTMLTGHGSYLALEWSTIAVVATRWGGRGAAVVAGLAAAMATHNHPVAAALLVGLLVLLPRWELAAAWAVGMAPHAWLLASRWGEPGGIADRVGTVAGEGGALASAAGELWGVAGVLVVLGLALRIQGKQREPIAALAALAAALGIVAAMGYGRPWMLRPLWPLLLLGAGVGWAQWRAANVLVPVLGGLALVLGVLDGRDRAGSDTVWPSTPWRLSHARHVADVAEEAGSVVAVGPAMDPPAELLPVYLDLLLRGHRLPKDRGAIAQRPVVVWEAGGPELIKTFAWVAPDVPAARAALAPACGWPLEFWSVDDALRLVDPDWPGGPPPAWPDCAQPTHIDVPPAERDGQPVEPFSIERRPRAAAFVGEVDCALPSGDQLWVAAGSDGRGGWSVPAVAPALTISPLGVEGLHPSRPEWVAGAEGRPVPSAPTRRERLPYRCLAE